MRIILVRHGQTEGNKERRFIGGRTDEPVSREGLLALAGREYPAVEHVFSSPMLRCTQTALQVFGERTPEIIEEFRECDFGILEGRTHRELEGLPEYEAFTAAGGSLPFPGGEAIPEFYGRCREAMCRVVEESFCKKYGTVGCTVHGGVIMAVMSLFVEGSEPYDWNVENGEGYILEIEEKNWKEGKRNAAVIGGVVRRIYT